MPGLAWARWRRQAMRWNRSDKALTVQRIAQKVIVLVVQAASRVVEDVEASSRGQSGFDSTGRG